MSSYGGKKEELVPPLWLLTPHNLPRGPKWGMSSHKGFTGIYSDHSNDSLKTQVHLRKQKTGEIPKERRWLNSRYGCGALNTEEDALMKSRATGKHSIIPFLILRTQKDQWFVVHRDSQWQIKILSRCA